MFGLQRRTGRARTGRNEQFWLCGLVNAGFIRLIIRFLLQIALWLQKGLTRVRDEDTGADTSQRPARISAAPKPFQRSSEGVIVEHMSELSGYFLHLTPSLSFTSLHTPAHHLPPSLPLTPSLSVIHTSKQSIHTQPRARRSCGSVGTTHYRVAKANKLRRGEGEGRNGSYG